MQPKQGLHKENMYIKKFYSKKKIYFFLCIYTLEFIPFSKKVSLIITLFL